MALSGGCVVGSNVYGNERSNQQHQKVTLGWSSVAKVWGGSFDWVYAGFWGTWDRSQLWDFLHTPQFQDDDPREARRKSGSARLSWCWFDLPESNPGSLAVTYLSTVKFWKEVSSWQSSQKSFRHDCMGTPWQSAPFAQCLLILPQEWSLLAEKQCSGRSKEEESGISIIVNYFAKCMRLHS